MQIASQNYIKIIMMNNNILWTALRGDLAPRYLEVSH